MNYLNNWIMKKTLVWVGLLSSLLLVNACSSGTKSGSTVEASDAVETTTSGAEVAGLSVDAAGSFVSWKGFKPGGEHFGKLPVSAGTVAVVDGKLYGGYVELAMNGIIVEDLEGEMAATLKAHLENEDFFEAGTYPTSRFELTDIPSEGLAIEGLTELKGNLTLKDVTKNISIPVEAITAEEGGYTFVSKTFRINRVDWNVKYGSKTLFGDLGDKFIDDEIELQFVLKAK